MWEINGEKLPGSIYLPHIIPVIAAVKVEKIKEEMGLLDQNSQKSKLLVVPLFETGRP